MALETGTKLLVCHRRLFLEDHARWFAGVVDQCSEGLAWVSGFTWSRDPTRGIERKADRRTKLIALTSGNLIVYVLPPEVDVEALEIRQPHGHAIVLTDGGKFRMDLSERI